MKNWLLFILLALPASAPFTVMAQSKPEARNLEVDPKPTCETEKLFLALFHNELIKDPTSKGIIVVKGDPTSMRSSVIFESSIKNFLSIIATDSSRYELIRSNSSRGTTWEMWIVPAGAKPPEIEQSVWSYRTEPGSRPYLFTWENIFEDDICPPVDDVKLFAEFLRANPDARGNIVIRSKRMGTVEKIRQRVLLTLSKTYRVPKSRLRLFVDKEIPTTMKPRVEYWFVP